MRQLRVAAGALALCLAVGACTDGPDADGHGGASSSPGGDTATLVEPTEPTPSGAPAADLGDPLDPTAVAPHQPGIATRLTAWPRRWCRDPEASTR